MMSAHQKERCDGGGEQRNRDFGVGQMPRACGQHRDYQEVAQARTLRLARLRFARAANQKPDCSARMKPMTGELGAIGFGIVIFEAVIPPRNHARLGESDFIPGLVYGK